MSHKGQIIPILATFLTQQTVGDPFPISLRFSSLSGWEGWCCLDGWWCFLLLLLFWVWNVSSYIVRCFLVGSWLESVGPFLFMAFII